MTDAVKLAMYRKTKARFLRSLEGAPEMLMPPPPQVPQPHVPVGLRPLPDAKSDGLVPAFDPFEDAPGV